MGQSNQETFEAQIERLRAENERRSKEIRDEANERRAKLRRALAGPRKHFNGP